MTSTSRDLALASADLGGAVVGAVLRASDKSLLALGQRRGLPVVIKALRTGEEFWQAKFDHEIRLHQAFTQNPPPVRVPTLVHTDGHRALVIEHIPGHPVDAECYPEQPLPATTLDAVLDTITTFALWTPPCAGAGVRLPRPRRALPPRGVLRRHRPHHPPCSPRGGWAGVAGQSRRPARGGKGWDRLEQLAFDLNDLARRSPCCSATARLCRRSLCPSPRTA
jgi:hypothetical protein